MTRRLLEANVVTCALYSVSTLLTVQPQQHQQQLQQLWSNLAPIKFRRESVGLMEQQHPTHLHGTTAVCCRRR